MLYLVFILFVVGLYVLGFVEDDGTRKFSPDNYQMGARVYRETRLFPEPELPVGSVFETESGRFKVIGPGHCLFYTRSRESSEFATLFSGGLNKPRFEPKGSLLWVAGRATAEARMPVYMVLLYVIVLTLCTAISLLWTSRCYGAMAGVASLLLSWAIGAGSCALQIRAVKLTVRRILIEYEALAIGQRDKPDKRFQLTGDAPR
jgi:hypothetical protein